MKRPLTQPLLRAARLVPDADVKEVASDPPNIRTNPVKKGNIESVLFAKPSYNAIGDPFKEAAQTMLRREDREAQIKAGNDKRFKPARAVRQPVVSAYEHMQDFIQVEKNFRSDENPREVVTAPRNFLTNPPKVGKCGKMTTFAGQVPYMNEGFDIPKQLAAKEIERSHALRDKVHNGKNFSQKAKQTHLFNSHKDVLHDPKANGPLTREARHRSPPLMEHDKPFKPSNPPKRGYNKSLAPFPVYIPDPKKGLERKRDEEDGPPSSSHRTTPRGPAPPPRSSATCATSRPPSPPSLEDERAPPAANQSPRPCTTPRPSRPLTQ